MCGGQASLAAVRDTALILQVRTAANTPGTANSTRHFSRRRPRVWRFPLSLVPRTAPRCRAEGVRCWWAERASEGAWAVFGVGDRGMRVGKQEASFGVGAAGPVRAALVEARSENGAGCESWPSNHALHPAAGRGAFSLRAKRCSAPAAGERAR